MEEFHQRCKGWRAEGEDTETIWGEIRDKIRGAVKKDIRRVRRWGIGERTCTAKHGSKGRES